MDTAICFPTFNDEIFQTENTSLKNFKIVKIHNVQKKHSMLVQMNSK